MGSPVSTKLCITSYNSTGYGIAARNYIQTLVLFSDILCVQEHFLPSSKDKRHSNTNKLVNDFRDNHDMFIIPAFKNTDQVTKGRGQGGLATIWKKSLTKYVSKISTNNFRVQATKFTFPTCHLLVINAYFPCDPQG